MMENLNVRLFRINFMLKIFVALLFSTETISSPVTNIFDVMRSDTKLCDTSKFLYESKYVKSCATLKYPSAPLKDLKDFSRYTFLCLGVYDTAYKICQYSSHLQIFLNSTAMFDSYVNNIYKEYEEKFIPTMDKDKDKDKDISSQQHNFCQQNLHGFTSLYNKTDKLWELIVNSLNDSYKCSKICFDIDNKMDPVCAILTWIKSVDDKKGNGTGTRKKPVDPEIKTQVEQLDERTKNKPPEIELDAKEKKMQKKNISETAHLKNNNNAEKDNKLIPSITVPNENKHVPLKTDTDNQLHHEQNDKSINTNNSPSTSAPLNNAGSQMADNVPNQKLVNEKNIEESEKKQDINNVKSTTISENTQDNDNVDEDEEPNIENVVDETLQQPLDTENQNQNENSQEVIEQKSNLQYPNIRIEDDSHFFTYFTVIIVICIAGYVGYHNKQKIVAILLEGRRSRNNRGRRRPSTANYRKLDCTLEEAVTSQCNANVTHVIY